MQVLERHPDTYFLLLGREHPNERLAGRMMKNLIEQVHNHLTLALACPEVTMSRQPQNLGIARQTCSSSITGVPKHLTAGHDLPRA